MDDRDLKALLRRLPAPLEPFSRLCILLGRSERFAIALQRFLEETPLCSLPLPGRVVVAAFVEQSFRVLRDAGATLLVGDVLRERFDRAMGTLERLSVQTACLRPPHHLRLVRSQGDLL